MSLVQKLLLTCKLCKKIFQNPIKLPCGCSICHSHLTDSSFQNGTIKCMVCLNSKSIDIENFTIEANENLNIMLKTDDHLNYSEKLAKKQIHDLIMKCESLTKEEKNIEMTCYDHFSEIINLIDIERESKLEFNEIGLDMISKVKDMQSMFMEKFKKLPKNSIQIEEETNKLNENFRRIPLEIEKLKENMKARLQDVK